MDWIYFILILAFVCWSAQIVMVYRRQSVRIDEQIEAARANQEGVAEQAETYEARAQELAGQLQELKEKASTLANTEKGLEAEVAKFRQQADSRRPTRFRVTPDQAPE